LKETKRSKSSSY